MKQQQKCPGWADFRTIVLAIGLLGSTQAFATNLPREGASLAPTAPGFLGGIALAESDAAQPAMLGPVYSAYDAEAIGLHLEFAAPQATGVDTMHTAAITPGVFGSVAIPMRNFPVSARWAPIYRAISGCAGNGCGQKNKAFTAMVEAARKDGFMGKLDGINRGINDLIAYKRDKTVYGNLDHWAKPAEILKRGAGDCEDFAILKMAALLDAGIPAQSMSLVVLQDSQKGVFHAVLSVTTSSGTFILDNVRNHVAKDTSLPNYVPLYSFSTNRAWIHGSKSAGGQVAEMRGGFASIAPGEGSTGESRPASRKAKRAGGMPAVDG